MRRTGSRNASIVATWEGIGAAQAIDCNRGIIRTYQEGLKCRKVLRCSVQAQNIRISIIPGKDVMVENPGFLLFSAYVTALSPSGAGYLQGMREKAGAAACSRFLFLTFPILSPSEVREGFDPCPEISPSIISCGCILISLCACQSRGWLNTKPFER